MLNGVHMSLPYCFLSSKGYQLCSLCTLRTFCLVRLRTLIVHVVYEGFTRLTPYRPPSPPSSVLNIFCTKTLGARCHKLCHPTRNPGPSRARDLGSFRAESLECREIVSFSSGELWQRGAWGAWGACAAESGEFMAICASLCMAPLGVH